MYQEIHLSTMLLDGGHVQDLVGGLFWRGLPYRAELLL